MYVYGTKIGTEKKRMGKNGRLEGAEANLGKMYVQPLGYLN